MAVLTQTNTVCTDMSALSVHITQAKQAINQRKNRVSSLAHKHSEDGTILANASSRPSNPTCVDQELDSACFPAFHVTFLDRRVDPKAWPMCEKQVRVANRLGLTLPRDYVLWCNRICVKTCGHKQQLATMSANTVL
jgi:hypothetical protein